ncbi:pyruvate formate lyase family protein [candidate division CSSED10-310 bacterium]|uniref:Pyruvate formate lyase family protein n=1 Tax=candidate division CSSED10-310 bacterium TaxID=2855610 RepID=A0ABV6Z5B2_UNCC1
MKLKLNFTTHVLLQLMALNFNIRPALRKYLRGTDGWIDFGVGFKTETGGVEQAIYFKQGRVTVHRSIPGTVDVTLRFINEKTLREMLRITPNEMLTLILQNKIIVEGNFCYLQVFNFFVSLLLGRKHQRMLDKVSWRDKKARKEEYTQDTSAKPPEKPGVRKKERLRALTRDPGVLYLDDPYLSDYSLDDFPRLQKFLTIHFNTSPELCAERPALLTDWFRSNGFEVDNQGASWNTDLRQARAFHHLMANKKPLIREDDLLAGTSTTKEIGVILYPDSQGTMIWGELRSLPKRLLNPYAITKETFQKLHHDVFPYWARRNFREWVRARYDYPLAQKIDERFVAYFIWKSVGISHTVPDFRRVLTRGIKGMLLDIEAAINTRPASSKNGIQSLQAMAISLEGVLHYARNLAQEAARLADSEANEIRKKELSRMAEICAQVPANPSTSLDEALHVIWIIWVALHMENTNTGLSLGRLDQILQPYFEADMARLHSPAARREYLDKTLEMVGCFFMRGTDHLPLVPDIGNFLFGGSSSDQAITLGGVDAKGQDAVNDMTYIFLKVTDMLAIRDPNVNARYHPHRNSDTYLKRLCEVNYVTAATPSMHNDEAVYAALRQHDYPPEDIWDWSATGCVEPTLSGKHMGHTGSILFNLVAPLEMAFHNGYHPLMKWHLGPQTGNIENGDFHSFEDFFGAYASQLEFLIDQATHLNNLYADVHARERPTPLLSSLMQGPLETGCDVTRGGALYNTSGTANIGLADVTDSLLVMKKLVFDEQKVSLTEFKNALLENFKHHPTLLSLVKTKVAKFGSGDQDALNMTLRIMKLIRSCYHKHRNYRGGRYTTGFWSMSQHVAYGSLSGALPSGRLTGKAFTPGLTPHPEASDTFLDNIRDVAQLHPTDMDNNIAFNVKIVPGAGDTQQHIIDTLFAYVKTYFELGGMQMQFNVLNSETLKDAMVNPEHYKNLLVRISGYNAYFVTLNKEMQIELIERAEYNL